MDDFTKKDKYASLHSAIKDVVSQNNDLYQKSLEEKYGFKRGAKGSTISYQVDIEKVKSAAPVRGAKSLETKTAKALDQKFKNKLGDYELEVKEAQKNTGIYAVTITTDQKLSKKDDVDIHNHLVDKGLKLF